MKTQRSPIDKVIYEKLFPRTLSRADITKLRILEAAIKTYSEIGIRYVSYEDIARNAKMNRPLINHHFPDKEILFETAVKFVRAKFQELAVHEILKHKTPEHQLKAYVESTVTWITKNPTHTKAWVFFFYQCMSDSKLKSLHHSLTTIGTERLIALLESGGEQGIFAINDLHEKSRNIQRIITGALLEIATEYDPSNKAVIAQIAKQTAALCLSIAKKE